MTAVLDVHSRVYGVYEPWNANADYDSSATPDYPAFVRRFACDAADTADMLLVKETATTTDYVDRLGELLRLADAPRKSLVLILRNPLHVFLSEVQARREWWGSPDLEVDADVFSLWAERTLTALSRLCAQAREFDALLLSYERFVASPRGVFVLTEALGLVPEPAQREFEKHLDRDRVRGDNNVGRAPRAVSPASIERRRQELSDIRSRISGAPQFERIAAISEMMEFLPMLNRASQQEELLGRLEQLCSSARA